MIKSSYEICRICGIPIKVDLSLIILFLLVKGMFNDPLYDLMAFVLLVVSIVLHELGHSLVARQFGCRVRDITLMLIGGAASLDELPRKPWQDLLVAAAGPAVSFLLGGLAIWLAAPVLVTHPVTGQPIYAFLHRGFQQVIYYAFGWGNLWLGIFNLIPAFPMDGGRILRALLQQCFMTRLKATWLASRIGRGVALLFVACVFLHLMGLDIPVIGGSFNLLLIAYFIFVSADREYRLVYLQEGGGWGGGTWRFPKDPPSDKGKVTVDPPPYGKSKTKTDVYRDE